MNYTETTQNLLFMLNDHLVTPQQLLNAAGQVVWQRNATPFGELAEKDQAEKQPLQFPGQYFDDETGYAYNYFRDYDASLGRYIQSDPIGLEGGVNTFGYVLASPAIHIDFDGLHPLAYVGWTAYTGYVARNAPGAAISAASTFGSNVSQHGNVGVLKRAASSFVVAAHIPGGNTYRANAIRTAISGTVSQAGDYFLFGAKPNPDALATSVMGSFPGLAAAKAFAPAGSLVASGMSDVASQSIQAYLKSDGIAPAQKSM